MRMDEGVKATGRFQLDIYEKKGGALLYTLSGPNLLVNVGRAFIAGKLSGDVTTPPHYIALGTNNTAAAAGDVALGAEITTSGGQRTLGTADRTTTSTTNDTLRVTATFTFTGSFSIVEAGLFDAITSGILVARRVFGAVAVVNGNVAVATWTVQFS